eukprot:3234319-Alexandrium_andersonii.AAC.1
MLFPLLHPWPLLAAGLLAWAALCRSPRRRLLRLGRPPRGPSRHPRLRRRRSCHTRRVRLGLPPPPSPRAER